MAIAQEKEFGGRCYDRNGGYDEKLSDYEHILKMEPKVFSDRLDVGKRE